MADITDEMVEKATFWNQRVRRVEPTRENEPLRWIFGPTPADPDPLRKWCEDCYGVVAEDGDQRWCRACAAAEQITDDPARQAVIDKLVRATGEAVRGWRRHQEHVSCSECAQGGMPTFEQLMSRAIEAALEGCAVVDLPDPDAAPSIDWDVIEAAVHRGIRDYARAYWIPANFLCGGVPEAQDRMAANWAKIGAPFITACIQEDLRRSAASPAVREVGDPS